MLIRDLADADLPALLAIHNAAVADTTAIWNDTPVDLADRRAFLAARRASGFAFLAAEIEGRLAGYASYGAFRPHQGYARTVENSVYVDAAFRGRGVARALMEALIAHAREDGMHVMVGGIEAGNGASIALHASLGFVETGRMPEVGRKFGRWLDLVLMQKTL